MGSLFFPIDPSKSSKVIGPASDGLTPGSGIEQLPASSYLDVDSNGSANDAWDTASNVSGRSLAGLDDVLTSDHNRMTLRRGRDIKKSMSCFIICCFLCQVVTSQAYLSHRFLVMKEKYDAVDSVRSL